jgi:titin
VPSAPANLTATKVSETRIDLTWMDTSSNETFFKLQRQKLGGTWSVIAFPAKNETSYSDTGLAAGTWCYRIRSHNADGFSDYVTSTPACIAVTGGGTTQSTGPNAPSDLRATVVSSNRVDLTWTDNSNDETYFKLQRKSSGGIWSKIAFPSKDQTSYSDTGLPAGTWCYRIRAHSSPEDYSDYVESVPSCVIVLGGGSGSLPGPSAPANVVARSPAGTSYVVVRWDDMSNDEVNFKLQWSVAGTEDWNLLDFIPANDTAYTHQGIPASTVCYRIRAQNGEGVSNYVLSEPNCVTLGSGDSYVDLLQGPAAPTDLVAISPSAGLVRLTWIDNATTEVDYKLQYTPAGQSNWQPIWIPADTESWNVNLPGGWYCFRLRAQGGGEVSNYILPLPTNCLPVQDPP